MILRLGMRRTYSSLSAPSSSALICPLISSYTSATGRSGSWPISLRIRCRASQTIRSPTWHRTDQHVHHSYKDEDSKKDDKEDEKEDDKEDDKRMT